MNDSNSYNYNLKYIIVGDSAVGKSNIMMQVTKQQFKKDHVLTIGVEFGSKFFEVDGKSYRVQIWDTAGQENFRSITRAYYKNSACAFLVYDITKKESFKNILSWLDDCKNQAPKNILTILIGNKTDLSQLQVKYEEGLQLANNHNMLFFETSALTGSNINETFESSVREIAKKIKNNFYDLTKENEGIKLGMTENNLRLNLESSNLNVNKKKNCCK